MKGKVRCLTTDECTQRRAQDTNNVHAFPCKIDTRLCFRHAQIRAGELHFVLFVVNFDLVVRLLFRLAE